MFNSTFCAGNHAERQAFISSSTRKAGLAILLLAFVAGAASAQNQPPGPPAFVTLPRHPAIERGPDNGHPMPLRLELREEMLEMVGVSAPGGGGGGNAGAKTGGGGADFGQNAAVLMTPD